MLLKSVLKETSETKIRITVFKDNGHDYVDDFVIDYLGGGEVFSKAMRKLDDLEQKKAKLGCISVNSVTGILQFSAYI